MNVMNEGSFQVPGIKAPALCFKQIYFVQKDSNQISYFLISTLDKKMLLINVCHQDKKLRFNNYIQNTSVVVTTFYFDSISSQVFLGYSNGNLGRMTVDPNSLGIEEEFYYRDNTNVGIPIILMYRRAQHLLIWNLNNCVQMISINTKKLINKWQFKQNITSGVSFKSPYSKHPVGCIAFDQGYPPIIFDCQVGQKFKYIHQNSKSIYQSQQFTQKQIIVISDNTYNDKQGLFIVFGVRSQKQNYISVYTTQYHKTKLITYLQPVYKFLVQRTVLHLSVKIGILMVSMLNSVLFIDLPGRKKQLLIQKLDLKVTWGFILGRSNTKFKFLVNMGFNYWKSEQYKQKGLKLRIRQKKKVQ